ncbi:hypothetical protein P186_0793 [Pyrobaculum ferrireducens]|uniref:Uncharacterized protein n=1 Tax=Pyrobaculum ferrireducens TaxID=1104324 RepID=G7VAK0_9CREN|nr:hypothetical protein P186_0793 [Pyrobaculum ferrireducens]
MYSAIFETIAASMQAEFLDYARNYVRNFGESLRNSQPRAD